MISVNKALLIGVLADEPVVQGTEGGQKIVGLSVFTTRRWCDAGKGQQEDKEWHRIVVTDPDLVACAQEHLGKDDQIYIEGELHTMFWRDETFDWQSLTKILLWQDGHRLKRITDDDDLEPAGTLDMLKAAREARLFETLGRVA